MNNMNNNNTRLIFVHALSPLHAGTGQGTGVIDLPIAREKATNLPILPGSSLKGTLRARCENADDCRRVFGPDMEERQSDDSHASSAQFSDQRLLLLPIRSLAGTFAWVTSPYILQRFARDIADVQLSLPDAPILTLPDDDSSCAVASDTSKIKVDNNVYLEDLKFEKVQISKDAKVWAEWIADRVFPRPSEANWRTMLIERFCIVHDDVFNFLVDVDTEVTARIRLQDDAKTVQDGALWYEEALPTETILSGIVLAMPTKQANIAVDKVFEVLQKLMDKPLQFGGKATVGRGMCRVHLTDIQEKGA
jgi:CRISPR-associated protein Cmr4